MDSVQRNIVINVCVERERAINMAWQVLSFFRLWVSELSVSSDFF
jgi:hypothetical protein